MLWERQDRSSEIIMLLKWDSLWNTKKSDDWILWGQSGVRVVANIWDNFPVWLLNYWVDSLFPDFIRVSVFYFQIFNIWSSWAQFSSQIQFCCLGVAKLLSQFIYFFKLSCLQEFWYVLLILAGAQCVSHSFIFFFASPLVHDFLTSPLLIVWWTSLRCRLISLKIVGRC